jgi:gluconate 5-dehydrogenase
MSKRFSLEGKTAFVTGASHGIGMAIAKAFHSEGATIVFSDTNFNLVQNGIDLYREAGITANGYICDVTNEDEVAETVSKIVAEFGKIDILVNSADIVEHIPALNMSAGEVRRVIDVDLVGLFIVSKAVAPGMIERGGGKIINICSIMIEPGRETASAYAAAKGGLRMLTKKLACEWAKYNIQVNGIGPGYIATPQTAHLRKEGHPFNDFVIAKTPSARWGTTEDLEGPAIFLASSASDFVNGHVLYVDGGILACIGKQPK